MSTRLTADERRTEVIAAATAEFAAGGYAGTATAAIARRAGVSQPYLFQLYRNKQELFLATVGDGFARLISGFETAAKAARAAGKEPAEVLEAMGHGYLALLSADRNLLRLQLHAYAACSDPEIQVEVRAQFRALWQAVARISGAPADELFPWFANGMLINVIASIDDARTLEEFGLAVHGGLAAQQ